MTLQANPFPGRKPVRTSHKFIGEPSEVISVDVIECLASEWASRTESQDPRWNVLRVGRWVRAVRVES